MPALKVSFALISGFLAAEVAYKSTFFGCSCKKFCWCMNLYFRSHAFPQPFLAPWPRFPAAKIFIPPLPSGVIPACLSSSCQLFLNVNLSSTIIQPCLIAWSHQLKLLMGIKIFFNTWILYKLLKFIFTKKFGAKKINSGL